MSRPWLRGGGRLFIAIYNDQGRASKRWLAVKKTYNRTPASLRWSVVYPTLVRLWGPTYFRDLLHGRPCKTWRDYGKKNARGMNAWRDVIDWIGGYPFEVAKPEEIFDFYKQRGFVLEKLKTCAGGHGCNEFVFKKI